MTRTNWKAKYEALVVELNTTRELQRRAEEALANAQHDAAPAAKPRRLSDAQWLAEVKAKQAQMAEAKAKAIATKQMVLL